LHEGRSAATADPTERANRSAATEICLFIDFSSLQLFEGMGRTTSTGAHSQAVSSS